MSYHSKVELEVHIRNLKKLCDNCENDALYETYVYCLIMLSKKLRELK